MWNTWEENRKWEIFNSHKLFKSLFVSAEELQIVAALVCHYL
jgi:hypothetical protein